MPKEQNLDKARAVVAAVKALVGDHPVIVLVAEQDDEGSVLRRYSNINPQDQNELMAAVIQCSLEETETSNEGRMEDWGCLCSPLHGGWRGYRQRRQLRGSRPSRGRPAK